MGKKKSLNDGERKGSLDAEKSRMVEKDKCLEGDADEARKITFDAMSVLKGEIELKALLDVMHGKEEANRDVWKTNQKFRTRSKEIME